MGRPVTHGYTLKNRVTPEYRAYQSARSRCVNQHDISYPRYGGRGIEFRFHSFEEFIADVGDRPSPLHSLDRKNTQGHYERGNIRWATRQEQQRNRRNSVLVELNGVRKTLQEWADERGARYDTAYRRLKKLRWCVFCALQNGSMKCTHKST